MPQLLAPCPLKEVKAQFFGVRHAKVSLVLVMVIMMRNEDDCNCHNDNDNLKRWNLGSVYKLLLSLRLMLVITVLVTLAVFGVTFMMIIFLFH